MRTFHVDPTEADRKKKERARREKNREHRKQKRYQFERESRLYYHVYMITMWRESYKKGKDENVEYQCKMIDENIPDQWLTKRELLSPFNKRLEETNLNKILMLEKTMTENELVEYNRILYSLATEIDGRADEADIDDDEEEELEEEEEEYDEEEELEEEEEEYDDDESEVAKE